LFVTALALMQDTLTGIDGATASAKP